MIALSACAALLLFSCDSDIFIRLSPSQTPSPSISPSPSPTTEPTPDATTSASPRRTPTPTPGYTITLAFQGPSTSSNTVYVAWIEEDKDVGEESQNLQNLIICPKLVTGGLTGTADPYWKRNKYPGSQLADAVTSASVQGNPGISIRRQLNIGNVRRFRVCFEIDRSWNGTSNFNDRPAFTYRSATIDLDDLQAQYDLSLYGWMSNDSGPALRPASALERAVFLALQLGNGLVERYHAAPAAAAQLANDRRSLKNRIEALGYPLDVPLDFQAQAPH